MKRVRVYKAKIVNKKVDKNIIRSVEDKKHEFIKERGVMDRTLEQFQLNEELNILQHGVYMEEVEAKKEEEKPVRIRRTNEQIKADKSK